MATDGYPIVPPGPPAPVFPPEDGLFLAVPAARGPRHRYWLHALLFAATLLTTTAVGAGLARSFAEGRPINFDGDLYAYSRIWHDPAYLLSGLPFSSTLLAILLAHEFGHYLTARYYHVNASLPFFIPAPTLIGTLGAFIRIRSVILSRRILFDIGIAGPLAGFALLVLPLAAGVSLSKVIPGIESRGDLIFGNPLILRVFEWAMFPGVAPGDLLLHPVARAAWVGLLATALNLLPIGQLDGGHIVYAFLGDRTRFLTRVLVLALVPMGFFFAYSWLVWAALLFFFGMRHPSIVDPIPVGRVRTRLAVVALAVFILSFTVAPIRANAL